MKESRIIDKVNQEEAKLIEQSDVKVRLLFIDKIGEFFSKDFAQNRLNNKINRRLRKLKADYAVIKGKFIRSDYHTYVTSKSNLPDYVNHYLNATVSFYSRI